MKKKKVFIIAPDSYGVDKAICDAFKSFGFEVILKNTRKKLCLGEIIAFKIAKEAPFMKSILSKFFRSFLEKDNKRYLNYIREANPDILFVIKGETVFSETLKTIKEKMRIPCIAYIWDCPFYSYMGESADIYRRNNFANGMHLYDHIFVYDPYYVEEIKKRGISNVSYLPLATDPSQYKRTDITPDRSDGLDFDVCFVGSPYPNRIKILDSLSEFNLGVFGDGWKRYYKSKKLPSYYKGKAVGEDVLRLYARSKIVLNIHDPEATYGTNTRTFDILACRAFELVDFKPELEELFKVGEEIVYYKDIEDLKTLIKFYLDNPEKRFEIAKKGQAKVLNSHTWHNRIKEVINVLQRQ